jgi:predicted HicB family RNase H-like nuclease
MKQARQFGEFVGVRMSPEERQALETLAQSQGLSLSETIRQMIHKQAQGSAAQNTQEEMKCQPQRR